MNSTMMKKYLCGQNGARLLLALLIAAIPRWPYSRAWGYGPSGGLGLVLLIIVVLLVLGKI